MTEEEKLNHIAERIATDVILRIQFEASHCDVSLKYKQQQILEEIVKILSSKI